MNLFEPLIQQWAAVAIIVAVALVLFLLVRHGLNLLVKRMALPRIAFQPLRFVLRWLIVVVAALAIAGRFTALAGVWTALTTMLAAIAIGFVAMWSVLSNTLCTFILILEKPFGIGDEVSIPAELGGVKGRVVDLTLLYTTLEGDDGELFQVPNNMFFQRVIRCKKGAPLIALEEQLKKSTPTRPDLPVVRR